MHDMIYDIISSFKKFRQECGRVMPLALLFVVLSFLPISPRALAAFDNVPEPGLLRRYAPVLYFHPEEKVYPWGIDSMLANADLKMLRNKREAPLPLRPNNLSSHNSDKLYLDLRNIVPYYNTLNTPSLAQTFANYPFRVYGRRVTPKNNPNYIVLQYWLFYPFNHWHNDHEGDWEMVQIRYVKDKHEPDQLTTSHHNSGTVVSWKNAGKINRTHPKIFVAKGGHGNWPTPGNHAVGKIWSKIGIFRDKTSEKGVVLYPGDILNSVSEKKRKYMLEDISNLPPSSWPNWSGRWGDVKVLFWGSKGPESPGMQDKWKNPIKWGNRPAKSSFWVYFGSPGVLHIYDPYDNHVGLTKQDRKDMMEGNIPGTYFYVPSSDAIPKDCAWINTSENLRFEIKATRSGKFHFSFDFDPGPVGQPEDKIAISVVYNDIVITKGGIARINVPSEKLTKRLEAVLAEEPPAKKEVPPENFESTELESTEVELENMANKTREYLKRKPKKAAYEIMEEALAELDAMLADSSMERSREKRSVHEADLNIAELELENMAAIARLSNKLMNKKGMDSVSDELKEIEDSVKGANLLERLLKPVLIMNIDQDGDGTVDEVRQPDRIYWMTM